MHTPSDGDWIREARNREIYHASEARWSREGITIAAPQSARRWLDGLKTLIARLKSSQSVSISNAVPKSNKLSAR